MKRKNQQMQEEVKREYGKMESFKLLRVFEGRDTVFFSAIINGVTIYNMRVVTAKDGTDFIAFPSEKGKDDKYYNIAYFPFSPDDTAVVIAEIENKLNED